MSEFQTSPGMRDILAPDSDRWRRFVDVFAGVVEPAGYELIVPPMMEDIGVFQRVGEATDVVSKEMYQFTDLGGRHVALRPEQTASVCRAFVQHRPTTPWKTWYAGPNFRYEKPQRGRYRQFDQVGVEVLGVDDAYLDVEVIALAWRFYEALGLRQVTLLLNSLGEPADRARYVDALRAHFEADLDALSAESQETLARNPLRVLDSKRDRTPPSSPPPRSSPTSSATTPPSTSPPSAPGSTPWPSRTPSSPASCAGSTTTCARRSSSPAARSTAPRTPSVAAAATTGSSRRSAGRRRPASASPSGSTARCWPATTRASSPRPSAPSTSSSSTRPAAAKRSPSPSSCAGPGARPIGPIDGRSMKAQMKAANRSGAAVAVIIGDDERAAGTAVVRPLRDGDAQSVVPRTDLLSHLEAVLT